jgi:hypothetical protein
MHRFIPYIPDITADPDSQKILHVLAEFNEVEPSFEKDRVEIGTFLNHQIYGARLAMITNRLLDIHQPGTGKTCLEMAISLELLNSTNLYKQFIVATTKALVTSTRFQFLCKCTDRLFLETSRTTGELEPSKLFKTRFLLKTHNDLHKMFLNDKDNKIGKTVAQLRQDFSGKVLFIDEVSTYIRNKQSSKTVNDSGVQFSVTRIIAELSRIKDLDDPRIRNSNEEYVQLWRFMHAVPDAKIYCLTGTPIQNHPTELFMLANLVLPLDKQYDIGEISKRILNLSLPDYKNMLGYVSYMGRSPGVARPVFVGTVIPHEYEIGDRVVQSQLPLYFKELYSFQAEKIFEDSSVNNARSINQLPQYFVEDENQEYVEIENENEDEDDNNVNSNIGQNGRFQSLMYRAQTCSLIDEVAFREMRTWESGFPGVAYIFNRLTNKIQTPLRKVFEAHGFEVVSGSDLKSREGSKNGICDMNTSSIIGLGRNIKKPRLVILDGKVSPEMREKVLNVVRSKDNADGRCIHCLVGSKVFEIGVNIGNTDRFYRTTSEWSPSAEEQSKDRVLRADSHPEYKLEFIRARDELPKYEDVIPEVDFYYFCPYSRFFFFDEEDLDKVNLNTVNTFGDTANVMIVNGKRRCRFLSNYIHHIVGFCPKGTYKNVEQEYKAGNPTYAFCESDEDDPRALIADAVGSEFSENIDLVSDPNYEMICLFSGVVKVIGDVYAALNDPEIVFVYTTGNIKELYHPKINDTNVLADGYEGYAITAPILSENPENGLVPLSLQVISGAYYQYSTMEEKSFIAKTIMRPVKQVTIDCIANKDRNILPPEFDNTAVCDYDKCEYACYSELYPAEKSDTVSELVFEDVQDELDDDGLFYDNKDLMYSKKLIEACTNYIIGVLTETHRYALTDVYSEMKNKHFREYVINMAIISILQDKYVIKDRFGFPCYVCNNNVELFLRRGYSDAITSEMEFPDVNDLVGVLSNQAFEADTSVDESILEKIETLKGDPDEVFAAFKQLRPTLHLYASQFRLLEDCYARAIFTRYHLDEFAEIIDRYPEVYENYIERDVDPIVIQEYSFFITKFDKVDEGHLSISIEGGESEIIVPTKGKINLGYDHYFVHTFQKEGIRGTKQNIEKKLMKVKSYRIFDFIVIDGPDGSELPVPGWRDPTVEEYDIFLNGIQRVNERHLNQDMMVLMNNGEMLPSPYYTVIQGKKRKFVDRQSTKRKTGGVDYDSAKTPAMFKAVEYFLNNVQIDEYDGAANAIETFITLYESNNVKKAEVKEAFRNVCEKLNLINYIDSSE